MQLEHTFCFILEKWMCVSFTSVFCCQTQNVGVCAEVSDRVCRQPVERGEMHLDSELVGFKRWSSLFTFDSHLCFYFLVNKLRVSTVDHHFIRQLVQKIWSYIWSSDRTPRARYFNTGMLFSISSLLIDLVFKAANGFLYISFTHVCVCVCVWYYFYQLTIFCMINEISSN